MVPNSSTVSLPVVEAPTMPTVRPKLPERGNSSSRSRCVRRVAYRWAAVNVSLPASRIIARAYSATGREFCSWALVSLTPWGRTASGASGAALPPVPTTARRAGMRRSTSAVSSGQPHPVTSTSTSDRSSSGGGLVKEVITPARTSAAARSRASAASSKRWVASEGGVIARAVTGGCTVAPGIVVVMGSYWGHFRWPSPGVSLAALPRAGSWPSPGVRFAAEPPGEVRGLARSGSRRSGRFADDQLRCGHRVGHGLAGDELLQEREGPGPQILEVLIDRGQRGLPHGDQWLVVEADHGDVFRHPYVPVGQSAHESDGDLVVSAQHCGDVLAAGDTFGPGV